MRKAIFIGLALGMVACSGLSIYRSTKIELENARLQQITEHVIVELQECSTQVSDFHRTNEYLRRVNSVLRDIHEEPTEP